MARNLPAFKRPGLVNGQLNNDCPDKSLKVSVLSVYEFVLRRIGGDWPEVLDGSSS